MEDLIEELLKIMDEEEQENNQTIINIYIGSDK